MTTLWILQRLYTLDASSPDFLRHLYFLLRHDEEEKYLTSLQGPRLARLIDFLDNVHAIPSAFHQFTKPTLQALGTIHTTDDVTRKCLRKLQAICGHNVTLPSSYIVSGEIARVGDDPIAFGVITDLWEGIHRGNRVSIKPLRVPLNDDQVLRKVRVLHSISLSRLRTHMGPVVILRRRNHVETINAPEHCPFHRRYNKPFANPLRVDAKWNSDRVHREKPKCETY